MVLHRAKRKFSFHDYGIDIPVTAMKTERTLKYLLAQPSLANRVGEWLNDGLTEEITKEDLLRVHSPAYVERLYSDGLEEEIIRTFELTDESGNTRRYDPRKAVRPLSELMSRTLLYVSGTYQCCRIALDRGFCYFFGGGMHHGQRDYGKGFCLLNDVAIAIRKLQANGQINTAWVIDVDVHKGDGTAALTEGDDSVTTLSIHMARGWPLDGEKTDREGNPNPSFIPSDIDLPVEEGREDDYLPILKKGLERLDAYDPPDLTIVVSGVDPYELDELPSTRGLKLSKGALMERDVLVYRFLKNKNIPRAYLMAGGYGEHAWEVYAQFVEWALLDNL
jgi:acetoin utilization deacetylase AcuC-like enzyme